MPGIQFAFVLHDHQPLGNFETVFEESYRKAYAPFLEVLERHPGIPAGLHHTGILMEWIEGRHPEYLERLRSLALRGQVEVLTGAFYEPILSSIPERDKVGQIRKLTGYLKDRFGVEARGLWLAERVWEPSLPVSLAEAGVAYTLLDDAHFDRIGVRGEERFGYFITEEQGRPVAVFPINQQVRHAIPFEAPEKTLEALRSWATEGGERLVVFADDGEKLGSWPETHRTVYTEGWLERFFTLLERNSGWIRMTHLSDFLNRYPSNGVIYLPTASYSEMLQWSGGFWRNFLRKYPEANWMHKRMMQASREVEEAESPPEALEEVWKSQCNCPYWHGVFGGLYLPHLRRETYTHILRAENALKPEGVRYRAFDLDADGADESILENGSLALFFDTDSGGMLTELDIREKAVNLINTLARREEPYYPELLARSNGHLEIVRDWYRRGSLVDHFLRPDTTLERFLSCNFGEQGDFVNQPYRTVWDGERLSFVRQGNVWAEGVRKPVTVLKEITLTENTAEAFYRVESGDGGEEPLWFGVEMNFSLSSGDEDDRYLAVPGRALEDSRPRATGSEEGVSSVSLVDEWLGIEIALSWWPPATFWRFPIETLSQSEEGVDRIYQSTVVFPHWKGVAEGSGLWEARLRLQVSGRP